MYIKVLTVTALNTYIKKSLDNDFILSNIHVKGEISNLKIHDSGHIYFSLKDESGKINAVMFRGDAQGLNFVPENGTNVEITGRVSVYVKEGSYQLYCSKMIKSGIGELYADFIRLKERLEKEGLFDIEHKRPIPVYPKRIGVITSPTGAAVRDIINVSKRRNRNIDILIYPSLVQGQSACEEIIKGIRYLNSLDDIDVIIIARGGGSIEELWSFNDEALAYEVYKSKKPVISGVGHETDFTIIDFVSDRRAPTPSAAAEIAVPSLNELNTRLDTAALRLRGFMESEINDKKNRVDRLKNIMELNNPTNYIVNVYNYIDNLKNQLNHNMDMAISIKKQQLAALNAVLNAHNPLNVLNKGYSIIQDRSGNVISGIDSLKEQRSLIITLKDGRAEANVSFKGE